MTPTELYEWAKDHNCEDMDMQFTIDVGESEVDIDIYRLDRPTNRFVSIIKMR